jgi:pyruvate,water dikinase
MSGQSSLESGRSDVVVLGEGASTQLAVVGGKGASLGRLVKAGFPVPSGFVITTDAYAECIRANDLKGEIEQTLTQLDYGNVDDLEEKTALIRDAILGCSVPDDLGGRILGAYQSLGDRCYVAIRSSGTAEDLEGASFAGQYDTYLDIRGSDALLQAVKRCWASMWAARVTAYRHDKGFGQSDIGIAVVVQMMVEPKAAGVMFVGNPMSARADETVINASWGLGESVVSGSVTPDEYILGRDAQVKHRTLGSKTTRVARDPQAGTGTLEEPVPESLRGVYTLSDEQAGELAEMGREVAAYYDGLPQDIEWALADDSFYLLQSRPVTGVDFTWEEDLDLWPDVDEDDDVIWSRSWADEFWHGAITPLFWTVRGSWLKGVGAGLGMGPMLGDRGDWRWLKYHRGTVYFDTRVDERVAEMVLPSNLRQYVLSRVHPSRIDEVINAPFDFERIVQMHTRTTERRGGRLPSFSGAYRMFRPFRKGGDDYEARREGSKTPYPIDRDFYQATVDREKLQSLGDDELFARVERIVKGMGGHGLALTAEAQAMAAPPYRLYVDVALKYIMEHWYSGDNPNAYTDVISGLPERTQQGHDDYDFWRLAETIRNSDKLLALLTAFEGAAFFDELKHHEEGRAFLVQYEAFLEMNGCRGHADRDIYYPRRIEDPMIDYQALRLLATADSIVSPEEREEKLRQRREAATSDVIESLEKQSMGELKTAAFKFLQDVTLKQWIWRDDERPMGDTMTWSKKLLLCELGRRTVARGLLAEERDFYFLGFEELRGLLGGSEPRALARAKVAGRVKAFDRFIAREENTPLFLKGRIPMEDDDAADSLRDASVLRGAGTSPGSVTARARIVPSLDGIGRLEKGDILICNSTDPGWTPVFSIVSGIVGETGGMAAHFSCLSREYGIPAVSLPNAMRLIEDGSMITVNGSTGEVRLASDNVP